MLFIENLFQRTSKSMFLALEIERIFEILAVIIVTTEVILASFSLSTISAVSDGHRYSFNMINISRV